MVLFMIQVIAAGKGELVVVRRPADQHKAADFLPCHVCFGFFLRKALHHHVKNCKLRQPHQTMKRSVAFGEILLSPFCSQKLSGMDIVLDRMRDSKENKGTVK